MRDFGKISWRIWRSKKFRKCGHLAKLTYFNLHTNADTSSVGLLASTGAHIAADMQETAKAVNNALAELHNVGLIIWDEDEELILITQFLDPEFNPITNGKHGRGALNSLKHVKSVAIRLHVLRQMLIYKEKLFDDDLSDVKETVSRLDHRKGQQNQQPGDTPMDRSMDTPMDTPTKKSDVLSDIDIDKDTDIDFPIVPKGYQKGPRTKRQRKPSDDSATQSIAKPLPDIPPQFSSGWSAVLSAAGGEMDDKLVSTWIEPLIPDRISGDSLVIKAPSKYVADWVTKNFGGELRRWCRPEFGTDRIEVTA